MLLIVTG
jgi:hypothetical protein